MTTPEELAQEALNKSQEALDKANEAASTIGEISSIPAPSPRNVFVSMLFALVIGNSAVTFFSYFTGSPENLVFSILSWLLGMLIVTTSWSDWSLSFTENNNNQLITNLLSREFLLLLLDIAILYFYYALFIIVERNAIFNIKDIQETYLVLGMIFFLYFVWDFINYFITKKIDGFTALGPNGICTLACLAIYFIVIALDGTYLKSLYFAAFALILFFRFVHAHRKKKL